MTDQKPPPIPTTGDMAYDGTELLKSMMMSGVKQMLSPTIVQASCGGYITIIDGVGVFASTTLQEAFDFAAVQAEKKMGAKVTVDMNNLPRFMQPKAWERAKQKIGLAPVVVLAAALSVLGVQAANKGADHVEQRTQLVSWERSQEPQTLEDRSGDQEARGSWPSVLPEVDVRKVRTESYGKRAQSSISAHAPRRLRTHHRPRSQRV